MLRALSILWTYPRTQGGCTCTQCTLAGSAPDICLTQELRARLGSYKTGLSPPPSSILILTSQGGTSVVVPYCYLFLLSVFILWVTYYVSDSLGSWMTTCLGKSCSSGLPRVPFVNCWQFMYLVLSLLVLRAGYGIWLYQFLIIAYLFTLHALRVTRFRFCLLSLASSWTSNTMRAALIDDKYLVNPLWNLDSSWHMVFSVLFSKTFSRTAYNR